MPVERHAACDLRRATVAIEDERFYKHKGVDFSAIVRAGIKNLESGETVQGGSTITQQLVRALYIKDPKRNFARKIREAKLASELEEEHSKTLDPRELPQLRALRHRRRAHRDRRRGGGGHVLRQARQEPRRCTSRRCSPGLPQAPSQYNPFRNPQAAIERRNEVLEKMVENGYITRGRVRGRGQPGPRASSSGTPLHAAPRALLLRLRAGAADRALRRRRRAPRRPAHPHDDRPEDAGRRARRDQRLLRRPGRTRARRSWRSTRPTARSGRWRRAAPTASAASTSPPRATASPARRSRRSC